jgi:RNA-binding motif X-linked protein 2
MHRVKAINHLNQQELRLNVPPSASWHAQYAHSAYIYVGSLPYDLNEGDLIVVFSQFGEIVDCKLIRDKETGKSKGFAFICYEDQRSTILAVDNLNGASLCGRQMCVDHVDNYEARTSEVYEPSG